MTNVKKWAVVSGQWAAKIQKLKFRKQKTEMLKTKITKSKSEIEKVES
jgi:hypothetical protein